MKPEPHISGNVGRVPLFDRAGDLRAWTTVDADVFPWVVEQGAWSLSAHNQAVRSVVVGGERQTLGLHRAVLGLPAYGAPKVSHLDRCFLNNLRSNLVVSRQWLAEALRDPTLGQQVLRLAQGAPPLRPPRSPSAVVEHRKAVDLDESLLVA